MTNNWGTASNFAHSHSSTPPAPLSFFQVPTTMHPTKKTIFFLAMALTMATHIAVAAVEEVDMEEKTQGKLDAYLTSLRRASSFLPENEITCESNPTLCFVSGSPGPYCCHKICVDINSDHYNCGRCKNKCKRSELCCSGNCVPTFKGCGSLVA